jgi:hypothetical protein
MKNIAGAVWFGLMFAVPSETDAQAIIMNNQQAVMNERDRLQRFITSGYRSNTVNIETQLKISRNQLVRIEKRIEEINTEIGSAYSKSVSSENLEKRIRQREARLNILKKDRLAVVKRIDQLESYRVSRKKGKSERITTDILDK